MSALREKQMEQWNILPKSTKYLSYTFKVLNKIYFNLLNIQNIYL